MVKYFTCQCANGELILRQVLQEAHISDWMTAIVHKGNQHCMDVLSAFPTPFQQLTAFQELMAYLKEHASFAIVIGYDAESFYWVNVGSNTPKQRAIAQAILERFA